MRMASAGAGIHRGLREVYPRAFKVLADLRASGDLFFADLAPEEKMRSEAARGGIHKHFDTDHDQSGPLSGPGSLSASKTGVKHYRVAESIPIAVPAPIAIEAILQLPRNRAKRKKRGSCVWPRVRWICVDLGSWIVEHRSRPAIFLQTSAP